jgi:enoyl-CoA hydratase/carnithine racemase
MGEEATYGLFEVKLGVFPTGGATQRLPRLVGLSKAKELVLKSDFVDAEEAQRCGLVHEVVPAGDDVAAAAREYADTLAEHAPLGMARGKRALNEALDMSLDEGLARESELGLPLYDTADRKEGFSARLEDREPTFEGE